MRGEVELLSWAGVVLFYVARDLAHAVFDADPDLSSACKHPTSHTNQDLANPGTNTVIKRHYRRVESAYVDLYSMSRGVRYEGQRLSPDQMCELVEELGEVARWAESEFKRVRRDVLDWMAELGRTPTTTPKDV
jgi:hypothetical protein